MLNLLQRSLQNQSYAELKIFLIRADKKTLQEFARSVGELVTQPNLAIEPLENLLGDWANGTQVELTVAAILAYGQVAIARPDWWQDEFDKISKAAFDRREIIQEAVTEALKNMLDADKQRTSEGLSLWQDDTRADLASVLLERK